MSSAIPVLEVIASETFRFQNDLFILECRMLLHARPSDMHHGTCNDLDILSAKL